MNRRDAIKKCVAGVLGVAAGLGLEQVVAPVMGCDPATGTDQTSLRVILRGKCVAWPGGLKPYFITFIERIRMKDVKAGDILKVEEVGYVKAASDGQLVGQFWKCEAEFLTEERLVDVFKERWVEQQAVLAQLQSTLRCLQAYKEKQAAV